MSIEDSLQATGIAEVMVILKTDTGRPLAASAGGPQRVFQHFIHSDRNQDAALLELLTARQYLHRSPADALATSALALGPAVAPAPTARYYPNLGIALGTVDRTSLAALCKEDEVAKVVPAAQLRLIKPVIAAAAQPATGYSWGLRALGIDVLHAKGHTGQGIVVGHLDTGVDSTHPALAGAIHAYAEFDSLGNQVDRTVARDSGEHGTHTAGTVVGRTISGVSFGMAPGAMLASAMVIEGGNALARILGGMNWIIGQGARVLSMSLGLLGTAETFLALTQALRAHGVLPVFAAGNDGPGTSRYPGNYAEALSVGAMEPGLIVADFSSSQRFERKHDPLVPDLVGPGTDVISCVPGGAYAKMSGTSMATPHIAGLAALLMGARPSRTIDEIEQAIFRSCSLPEGMLESRGNRGLPNAERALSLL